MWWDSHRSADFLFWTTAVWSNWCLAQCGPMEVGDALLSPGIMTAVTMSIPKAYGAILITNAFIPSCVLFYREWILNPTRTHTTSPLSPPQRRSVYQSEMCVPKHTVPSSHQNLWPLLPAFYHESSSSRSHTQTHAHIHKQMCTHSISIFKNRSTLQVTALSYPRASVLPWLHGHVCTFDLRSFDLRSFNLRFSLFPAFPRSSNTSIATSQF